MRAARRPEAYVHPGDKTTTFSMMLADEESGTVWALSTVSDVMLHDLGPQTGCMIAEWAECTAVLLWRYNKTDPRGPQRKR